MGTPTLLPTVAPSPGTSSPGLPPPKPAAIVAPAWAPEAAGPVSPREAARKKASPWLSQIGLGVGVPLSRGLGSAYASAFQVDLGSGLKVSDAFSIWLDLNLGFYNSKNDALTGGNNYTLIEAAFWGRFRLFPSTFSPYLFAGPGLAYNENRSDGALQYDPNTGYAYVPVNAYEIDLIAEGGLGLDLKMGGGTDVFLQGKLTCDFTSSHFAGYASTDSPVMVMPLEAGVIFGY